MRLTDIEFIATLESPMCPRLLLVQEFEGNTLIDFGFWTRENLLRYFNHNRDNIDIVDFNYEFQLVRLITNEDYWNHEN